MQNDMADSLVESNVTVCPLSSVVVASGNPIAYLCSKTQSKLASAVRLSKLARWLLTPPCMAASTLQFTLVCDVVLMLPWDGLGWAVLCCSDVAMGWAGLLGCPVCRLRSFRPFFFARQLCLSVSSSLGPLFFHC